MRISDWSSTCALPICSRSTTASGRAAARVLAGEPGRIEVLADQPLAWRGALDFGNHAGIARCGLGRQRIDEATRRIGATRQILQRSEEHTSELQSLMRISYAVFCLKKKKQQKNKYQTSTAHATSY